MLYKKPAAWGAALLLGLSATPTRAERNLMRPPGTTRYTPMVARLKSLLAYDQSQGAHRMALSSLGHSVKGRELWMVTLHASASASPPPADGEEATQNQADPAPKKLLCICRQHGHEPASTEGALDFITGLVRAEPESPLAQDLRRVTVYIVPMANPDGSEAFLRHNAHNVDLNRDWLRRTQPETQALYRAIQTLRPDWMTDQHELYPNDSRPDFTETAGLGSGARPDIISACDSSQDVVQGALRAEGYPTAEHRIDDHHPARLAHRYGCLVAGVPTVLFETNRLQGTGRSVAARAAAHRAFMTATLRDLAGERDQLLAEAASWQAAHPQAGWALASRHAKPRTVPPAPPASPEKAGE